MATFLETLEGKAASQGIAFAEIDSASPIWITLDGKPYVIEFSPVKYGSEEGIRYQLTLVDPDTNERALLGNPEQDYETAASVANFAVAIDRLAAPTAQ